MHTLQLTDAITESKAQEIIFAAMRGNYGYKNTMVGEYFVDFVEGLETTDKERLARVSVVGEPLKVIACAVVDSMDT
ncbi:hypothetical protein CNR33_00008 [Pseudomonas phage tabernarius]|uniref:Uncharacterized protein n=1 Tax=Pseudomonas phage tabernarius TaxID=2048978 RepID=A0A2H4P6Q0_9CAUD|nr:hypothetical protein FDJ17_gp08 [Pseudomonas phage tabernarius]ATW57854.1 hypothetical protein CNR33_00008 [Pseudomonas phage tabernarius]